jgi:hypothetical protein
MYKWPRKPDLEALGYKMGIKVSKCKSKAKLIAAIQGYVRYLECYNDIDPVSLESLHSIDDDRYVQWAQHGLVFGADSHSIRQLFANNLVTLPFALDLKRCKPDCDFDLRNVQALAKYNKPLSPPAQPVAMSFVSWIIHTIDALCGHDSGYVYGHVKNLLIDEPNVNVVYIRLRRAMRSTMRSLLSTADESTAWICDALTGAVVLPYKRLKRCTSTRQLLHEFIRLLQTFVNAIGSKAHAIVFLIFNDIR